MTPGMGFLERFAILVERDKARVFLGLLLLYTVDALRRAAHQPLWFDELITFHLAQLPSLRQVWAALLAAADAQPPLIYLLTRVSQTAFGTAEWATRLPAVISFGVLSGSLCALVARRAGFMYGLIAMLLAWSTSAYEFAYEARPYGLMLASSALALLCWQVAAEGGRRRLALAGLSLSLAAAVSSHYYAVLVLLPLAVGECVRSWTRKAFDVPVWISFALGAIPLLAYLPLIAAVRAAHTGAFWSPAEPVDMLGLYVLVFYPVLLPLLVILLFLAWISAKAMRATPGGQSARLFHSHERALLWTLALLPVFAVLAALATTGAFVYRYVIPALIGVCAIFSAMTRRAAAARPQYGAVAVLILLVWYGGTRAWSGAGGPPAGRESGVRSVADRIEPAGIPDSLPIVVTAPHVFLEADHYLSAAVTPRLVYLADPAMALEYSGTNTSDYNLSLLAPWASLSVFGYQEFVSSHPAFLLLHLPNHRFEWVTRKLADDGRRLSQIAQIGDFAVLRCCDE